MIQIANSTMRSRRRGGERGPGAGSGFTLVEMLVVITIIAVALAVVLPAFAKIIQSNNYTAARNAVTAALTRASQAGVDGGVVFLYDPPRDGRAERGRFVLQAVELDNPDGSLVTRENSQGYTGQRVRAAAYRPSASITPVELPTSTGVFGLSFVHDDPARLASVQGQTGLPPWARWYFGYSKFEVAGGARRMTENSWLFPRSNVQYFVNTFDPASAVNNPASTFAASTANDNPWMFGETFFVRFDADGKMLGSAGGVNLPRDAYLEFPDLPYNPGFDVGDARRVTSLPPNPSRSLDGRPIAVESRAEFDPNRYYFETGRPAVLNPEVKLRAVDQIAVVDLAALAAGTGLREPWYVRPADPALPSAPDKSRWVSQDDPSETVNLLRRISRWVDENGEIIGFGRYTGQAVKR